MEIELDTSAVIDTDTAQKLTAHIERIEGYEIEKKQAADLIKDEYAIAKGTGFDPKIMKHIIKMRKRSADDIQEEEALIEMYRGALGML
jgi:uncharacterized protein (UPF0335 family)